MPGLGARVRLDYRITSAIELGLAAHAVGWLTHRRFTAEGASAPLAESRAYDGGAGLELAYAFP